MNTSKLKSFAQDARNILKDGVQNSLFYWGFDKNGQVIEKPEEISGGCIFRGEVFNDPGILRKWHYLNQYITRHTVDDAIEQAAYTWFNRLIAISILEHNKLERPVILIDAGQDPPLLAEARTGILSFLSSSDRKRVKALIFEHHDEEAFGVLLTGYCRSHPLLNRIFGGIDDFSELLLPSNLLSPGGIIHLINNSEAITEEDFVEVELIGWLYQFYISDKKDEVFAGFKKNKKARAEDIPAATQIFTPRWIVKYMVENTVGKIWLDHTPDSSLRNEMKYIVENESSQSTDIISSVSDLKLLDPAVGSGHILVVGFDLILRMYQEEGYTTRQAIREVLKNNLFGLDIDNRAAQLASFSVLLKASFYDPGILQEKLLPNIYAMPEADEFSRQEIYEFLGSKGEMYYKELSNALILLQQGKNIGSALKLTLIPEARQFIIEKLNELLINEQNLDIQSLSITLRIKPFIKTLILLTDSYESVVTNPPYMGQKSMNGHLKAYIKNNYPLSKTDLFAVFMEVCFNLSVRNGMTGMINQQSWMFLSSFEKLRTNILRNYSILNMIHLGPRTFVELTGEVVQSVSFIILKEKGINYASYFRLIDYRSSQQKEEAFISRSNHFNNVFQNNFLKIPGNPIAYWATHTTIDLLVNTQPLKKSIPTRQGMATADNEMFVRYWMEVNKNLLNTQESNYKNAIKSQNFKWYPYNKGGAFRKWYGDSLFVIAFDRESFEVLSHQGNSCPSRDLYFKKCITWTLLVSNTFGAKFQEGHIFDVNGLCAFPNDEYFYYILALFCSKVAYHFLTIINPTLAFQKGNIDKLPLILKNIDTVQVKNAITFSRNESNSRETSWNFLSSPLLNNEHSLLEAFNARVNCISDDFVCLHRIEEELNKIFIDIYSLSDEISAEVPLQDITLYQEEIDFNLISELEESIRKKDKSLNFPILKDEIIKQFLSYLVGCLMGRYRLDIPGLNIAHPNPSIEETGPYLYNGYTIEIDKDAIIPLIGNESPFSDDVIYRVRNIIEAIWGEKKLTENINFIEEALSMNMEKFLTTKFWDYHKKMYKKAPIYWLFESPGGYFRALTYMHRMDKFTVQKIRLNYLHRYIDHLTGEISRLKQNGNDQRSVEKLEDALIDCRAYSDILKPLADRQITFDLDDGVKKNYKLFEGAVKPI